MLPPLEDEQRRSVEQVGSLPIIGRNRSLPAEALRAGRCEVLPDGSKVWRLELSSPGAVGLRVHFEDFDVGNGRAWVYTPDEIHGPYSGRGPLGKGEFWSATVFSDRVVIEYEPDRVASCPDPPPFRLTEIAHLWDDLLYPAGGAKTLRPQADLSCHLDVSCYPDYAEEASGVAQYSSQVGS